MARPKRNEVNLYALIENLSKIYRIKKRSDSIYIKNYVHTHVRTHTLTEEHVF